MDGRTQGHVLFGGGKNFEEAPNLPPVLIILRVITQTGIQITYRVLVTRNL
jgi:hypothetical protein